MQQEKKQELINTISKMVLQMTVGNFAYRIPHTGNEGDLEVLTVMVNMLAEEMQECIFQASCFNSHYSSRYVVQSSYILDSNFMIRDFSTDVPSLLGFESDDLLGKDFEGILTKKSSLIWKTVKEEFVKHETYQITVQLEFCTHDKLLIPVFCSISSLLPRSEIIINSFSVVIDDLMGKKPC